MRRTEATEGVSALTRVTGAAPECARTPLLAMAVTAALLLQGICFGDGAPQALREVEALWQERKYEETALRCLTYARKFGPPESVLFLSRRADALEELGRWEPAAEALEEAAESAGADRRVPALLLRAAKLRSELPHPDPMAIKDIERILEEFSRSPEAASGLGQLARIHRRWGKPAESIAALSRLIKEYPDSRAAALAWRPLGELRFRTGDKEGGLRDLRKGIELKGPMWKEESMRCMISIGDLLREDGNPAGAIEAYGKAASEDLKWESAQEACLLIAQTYRQTGQAKEAMDWNLRLLNADDKCDWKNVLEARKEIWHILLEAKQMDRALTLWREGAAWAEETGEPEIARAYLLEWLRALVKTWESEKERRLLVQAEHVASRLWNRHPDTDEGDEALLTLADVIWWSRRKADSRGILENVLLKPVGVSPELRMSIYEKLADFAEEEGNNAEAARNLELLARRFPDDPKACRALLEAGLLRLKLGEVTLGVRELRCAASYDPRKYGVTALEAHLKLADILWNLGRRKEAVRRFQVIAAFPADSPPVFESLLRLARCRLEEGELKVAEDYFRKVLARESVDNWQTALEARKGLTDIARSRGEVDKALDFWAQGLTFAKSTGKPEILSDYLAGKAEMLQWAAAQSKRAAEETEELYQTLWDQFPATREGYLSASKLVSAFWKLDRPQQAINLSIELLDKIGETDKKLRCELGLKLGEMLWSIDKRNQAVEIYAALLREAASDERPQEYVDALSHLASALLELEQTEKATGLLLSVPDFVKDKVSRARVDLALAQAYKAAGKRDEALAAWRRVYMEDAARQEQKVEALLCAADWFREVGDYAVAASLYERLVVDFSAHEEAERLLTQQRETLGRCFELAHNYRKARLWYTAVGLHSAAQAVADKLDRLRLVGLEVEDCYVGQNIICRVILANSFSVGREVELGVLLTLPDGKTNKGKLGPIQVPADDVADAKVAWEVTEPGLYKIRIVHERESIMGVFRAALPLPIRLRGTPGQAMPLPRNSFDLVSAATNATDNGWTPAQTGSSVSAGHFIQMTLEAEERTGVRFFYDPPSLSGILQCSTAQVTGCPEKGPAHHQGYHGDFAMLEKGTHKLRFLMPRTGRLENVYVEYWQNGDPSGGLLLQDKRLEIKAADLKPAMNLEKGKLGETEVVSAVGASACVDAVVSAETARDCYVEVLATDSERQVGRDLPFRVSVQGWPTVGDREAPLWLTEPEENTPLKRKTWLRPVHLEPGSNLLRVWLPEGESLAEVRVYPALEGFAAAIVFPDERKDFCFGDSVELPLTAVLLGAARQKADLSLRIAFQHVRMLDRARRSDSATAGRMHQAVLQEVRSYSLPASKSHNPRLPLNVPTDRYGLTQIVAVARSGEALCALPVARYVVVPNRKTQITRDDTAFISQPNPDVDFMTYRRIGIDWLITAFKWSDFQPGQNAFDWDLQDAITRRCSKAKLRICNVCSGAPDWAKPVGSFRDLPGCSRPTFVDDSPAPAHVDGWTQAWVAFLERYEESIGAVELLGEADEGKLAANWRSSGDHYRRLLKGLALARASVVPPPVLLAGGSAHNADWNVLTTEAQSMADVICTHGAHPAKSFVFPLARMHQKKVWDTWTDATTWGDREAAAWALLHLAKGTRKMNLFGKGELWDADGNPRPVVAWAAAMTHLLDGLQFDRFLHPERPPLVLLFRQADRKVAAVIPTMTSLPEDAAEFPWRQFQAMPGTALIINDPEGRITALDCVGNPIGESQEGKLVIPFGRDVVYLRSQGKAGVGFEETVSAAQVAGMRPVQIKLRDPVLPMHRQPEVGVEILNATSEPLSGKVALSCAGIVFSPGEQPFQLLQPGESTRFGFRIADCRLAGNAFPVTARVSSRPASATEAETLVTEMTEVLSVATIVNASIKVDGFLDEWPKAGAVPVLATRSEDAALRTKPLWCPWSELRQAALGTFARVAFAWDNTNLYVMAQVYDPEATRVPSLLSGVDRHQWQNAPADYIYYLPGPWPGSTGDGVLLSMDSANRSEWVRRYEEFPPDSNSYHLGSVLAGRYQYQVYPTREGGTEVFRFRTPDFYYRHQLPLNYARLAGSCAVPQAAAVCKRRTDTWYYEAAIPWSELGRLPHGKGQRLRINFRINDDTAAQGLVWSKNRSVAVPTYLDFEPTWVLDWSSETEWGFDAADRPPGASDARR